MSNRRARLTKAIRANNHRRQLRALAGELAPSGLGYPGPGTVNAYRCDNCGQPTITVHRQAGVTPMFITCRVTPGCEGRAVSGMYAIPAARLPRPTHEWYRPEDRHLAPGVRTHVAQGALILRAVSA